MKICTCIAATASALLFVLPTTVVGQDDIFTRLLNALLQPVVGRVCDTAQTELGLDGIVDCTCNATSRGFFRGVDGTVSCTLPEPRCLLPPSLFCADGVIEVSVGGGLFSQTALTSDITGCFQVNGGLPEDLASIEEICFNFVPSGFMLESCSATIGGVDCLSCTICESGRDFIFDCSNIDILPGPFRLQGPRSTTCIDLSLVPSNSTVVRY